MGYFSNGTEGDMYEAEYCNKCINEDDEKGCPVMLLHLIWNYEQHSDKTKKWALDLFIPERKDGFADQCKMFKPKPQDS